MTLATVNAIQTETNRAAQCRKLAAAYRECGLVREAYRCELEAKQIESAK